MSDIARTASIEDAMTQYGIPLPKKILGEHRFIRWGKNGRYYGRLFNAEGGVFGDWQSGLKVLWFAQNKNQKISRQEYRQKRQKIREERLLADKALYAQQSKLAIEQTKLFSQCKTATENHPYLKRKAIKPFGCRISSDGRLVIPYHDINGVIWTLQTIDAHGNKRFSKGARKKGMFHLIGNLCCAKHIYIGEGFSTMVTIHMATGSPVVVAGDAGNIEPVLCNIMPTWPLTEIIICGDDDCYGDVNQGRKIAEKLSQKYRLRTFFPEFHKENHNG